MDLEYFKCHIKDELEGAKDYIKRAIEIKPMDVSWAKLFVDMSATELQHATNLYNMFLDYCDILEKSYSEMPKYVKTYKDEITDMYTECTATVKMMHDMFK